MVRIADIKVSSSQGITIAHIMHDDLQTGEYLLQDEYSAQGVWFRTLDALKAEWRSVEFLVGHCLAKNCNQPTLLSFTISVAGLACHEEKLK